LRVNDFFASAVAVVLCVTYAILTDVGAPVWRATLMLILYLAAKLLYRQKSTLNTIGAAALALLVIEPRALFGASFQLSFLCVLVIAGVGVPMIERTTQPVVGALRYLDSLGYDRALSPRLVQFRLDLRMIAGRLQRRGTFFRRSSGFRRTHSTDRGRVHGDFSGFAGRICLAHGLLLSSRDGRGITGKHGCGASDRSGGGGHYCGGRVELPVAHARQGPGVDCQPGNGGNFRDGALAR
jgi:hypothetical protein